jgi:hypothetical protein
MPNVEPFRLLATEIVRRFEDGGLIAEAVVANCPKRHRRTARRATGSRCRKLTFVGTVDQALPGIMWAQISSGGLHA